MIRQGSGVILAFGGYGDPLRDHNLGGLQVASRASRDSHPGDGGADHDRPRGHAGRRGPAAVFAASDWAAGMTATKLDITAGSYVDAA